MLYNVVPEVLQSNKVMDKDTDVHDWYRFVLSYPPHIVAHYFEKFQISDDDRVLDPFSGTGTTVVEAKKHGIDSFGVEANPIARLASITKLDWSVNPTKLMDTAKRIVNKLSKEFLLIGIVDDDNFTTDIDELQLISLPPETKKLLLKDSINPVSLHKSIRLIEEIKKTRLNVRNHLLIAAASTIVHDVSNLKFGPEVGVGKVKIDRPLLTPWLNRVNKISNDLKSIIRNSNVDSKVVLGDARLVDKYFNSNSVDAIITSPPYPNEKDYSRTTRLENVLLGYVKNMLEQRGIKKTFIRSNTRSVYKSDQDHKFVTHIKSIQKIAKRIEDRRIELGKTSGFEKMYSKVTLQYFGGMAKHLAACKDILKPGAKLAYVVGDQASYLRVMIRTGHLLGEIAEDLGYKIDDIELFRTRFATRSKEELREEVLILTYNG